MENNKSLFKIPIINIWYIIISIVLILMRFLGIVDWHPLILIAPIWGPTAIALFLIFIIYLLKFIVIFIDFIYKKIKGY